ncbi:MAG: DUF2461 domain-containing protein [Phycicoccus sp.]
MTSGGIPHDAVAFYAELTAGPGNREWWETNRERYHVSVREPMELLLDALEDEFGAGRVYRPYRDVRFTKDKSPYKNHQGALVEVDPGIGYYVQVDADGLLTGGGFYPDSAGALTRLRAAIDDDTTGETLRGIVAALTATGFVIGGARVATRPRGVPADHPRLELMRHKSLVVSRPHGEPEWLDAAEVVEQVRADWREVRALVAWLTEHTGGSPWPRAGV